MKTERHQDGLWHVIGDDGTVCGRPHEPQQRGRPGRPTCRACMNPSAIVLDQDPPVRADGLYVVCDQPRRPERSRKYARGQADVDPFCSMLCARAWHRNPLPLRSIWDREFSEVAA